MYHNTDFGVNGRLHNISKREILEKCPDISAVTVSVALTRLCDEGFICKTGNGRNAASARIE